MRAGRAATLCGLLHIWFCSKTTPPPSAASLSTFQPLVVGVAAQLLWWRGLEEDEPIHFVPLCKSIPIHPPPPPPPRYSWQVPISSPPLLCICLAAVVCGRHRRRTGSYIPWLLAKWILFKNLACISSPPCWCDCSAAVVRGRYGRRTSSYIPWQMLCGGGACCAARCATRRGPPWAAC